LAGYLFSAHGYSEIDRVFCSLLVFALVHYFHRNPGPLETTQTLATELKPFFAISGTSMRASHFLIQLAGHQDVATRILFWMFFAKSFRRDG
jgi:hypothetical protein